MDWASLADRIMDLAELVVLALLARHGLRIDRDSGNRRVRSRDVDA